LGSPLNAVARILGYSYFQPAIAPHHRFVIIRVCRSATQSRTAGHGP
jgi:hypothetical protein